MFRKYTCITQHDETDCAAACIAMVSKYYGLKIPLTKIRNLASTDLVGTNVLGISEAGKSLGFNVKAVRAEKEELNSEISFPVIAHVNKEGLLHYVVIYKIKKDRVIIADPAEGITKITIDDFLNIWSGILIFLTPSETFEKGNEKKGIFERFLFLIKPNKSIIFHISIATLVNTFLGLLGAFYFKYLIDDILVNHLKNTLVTFTVGLVFLKIFKLILSVFRKYMVLHLSQKINSDLMLKYYEHVLKLPLSFFEKRKVGEITSRIGDAGKVVGTLSDIIFSVLIDSLMIIVVGGILFIQNTKLFMCAVAFIPLYLIVVLVFIKPFRDHSRKVLESHSQLESFLVESLNGIATIKSLGGEEQACLKFENKFIDCLEKSFNQSKLGMLSGFIEGIIDIFSNNLILLLGGLEVIKGNISIGQLLTFNTLFGYFFDPIQNFIDLIPSSQSAYVASDRLGEVLDIELEYKDKTYQLNKIEGEVEFKNVSFQYGNRGEVLKNLTFKARKGEKVAIVGESGSGKSTLIKLLMRYYLPGKGTIQIDGHNIKDLDLKNLRNRIAYVPQEVFLFSGSLMENLKFGFSEYSYDEILEACKKASVNEFVENEPQRYELLVGERGSTLSGGQKQRIALARAILKNADIIILDEATSSLDMETERKIHETIKEISSGKTLIIIAHRLSTIRDCDKIIVLSEGEIKEQGSHKELLGKIDGLYKKLWSVQMAGETNGEIYT